MKIVVLDGFSLNPGDLNWEGLKEIGDLTIYDRTEFAEDKIIEAIADAEIILTNKTPLSRKVLQKCTTVKYIGVLATGYNVVDIKAAKGLGIVVTNVPVYSTTAVAQMTMALLLEMCHHVGEHNNAVKRGEWAASKDFCFWNYPLIELQDKTIGIIGMGQIGQATAKLAEAFGMKILTAGSRKKPELASDKLQFVTMDELLENSDVISLHCPLLETTKGIINEQSIKKMKDGVMLINTSRGPLIVEKDLKNALDTGKVAYAAVDVVSKEPIDPNNVLLSADNCIITPHIAWAPKESRARLLKTAIDNLKSFMNNDSKNVVNS
ncbi:D-2-hydroxyacid dehydrogenase [Aurantibacter sp.]|uniref:D-2-hydroxyacid dehydrogenase n=1 Tax=Aurantibacter sp. TaxID=2807103 RepID=UPI0032649B48